MASVGYKVDTSAAAVPLVAMTGASHQENLPSFRTKPWFLL